MYDDLEYLIQGSQTSRWTGLAIWAIIAFVIAIAATVCIFVVFLNKKNENKFNGFLGWLYNFLTFKVLASEILLKVTYVCFAIYITLYSFALIGTSFGSFLGMLIGGNLVLRITYELLILIISICSNVSEINKKLKSSKETKGE